MLKRALYTAVFMLGNGHHGASTRAHTIVIAREFKTDGLNATGIVENPPGEDARHFKITAPGPIRLAWTLARALRQRGIGFDDETIGAFASIPKDWKAAEAGSILAEPIRS